MREGRQGRTCFIGAFPLADGHPAHPGTPLRIDMGRQTRRTAVIIGASSGIGAALAHELNRAGWRLGLFARRLERLEALRESLAPGTMVRRLDVGQHDAAAILERALEELGSVDLAIIGAG